MTISRLVALEHQLRMTCRRYGHERTVDLQALSTRDLGGREPSGLSWTRRAIVPDSDGIGSHICGGRQVRFILTPTRTHA